MYRAIMFGFDEIFSLNKFWELIFWKRKLKVNYFVCIIGGNKFYYNGQIIFIKIVEKCFFSEKFELK